MSSEFITETELAKQLRENTYSIRQKDIPLKKLTI